MRANSASQQKQQRYRQKIRLLDQHVLRASTSKQGSIDPDEILKMLASKLLTDRPQELLPFSPRVLLFQQKKVKKFYVDEVAQLKGKQYILSVNSYIQAKLSIAVNEGKPKVYSFQGKKAILIHHQPWKTLNISIQVNVEGPFSSVRIHLDSMQTEHKNPKGTSVKARPNINLQLDQYLKSKVGKTGQIIRSRSMTKLKESLSVRRKGSTIRSTFRKTARHSEMVKTKSQLFQFEKKKEFYIRHVERMSPQRLQSLKSQEVSYERNKRKHLEYLAKIMVMAKMGRHIYEESARIRYRKARQIKISLLCMDFVKIIRNKFRLKITSQARLRMTNLHYFNHLPAIMNQGCIQRARQTLLQSLMVYMDFRGLQEICSNSKQYLDGVITIQRFLRKRRMLFYLRIKIICDRLCYIYQIELPEPVRIFIADQYFKWSQSSNKLRFRIFKDKLLQMIREHL